MTYTQRMLFLKTLDFGAKAMQFVLIETLIPESYGISVSPPGPLVPNSQKKIHDTEGTH